MMGKLETPKTGLITRTMDDIFSRLSCDNRYSYTVNIAYLQIYTENIQDLINPILGNLKIRECPERGVFVEDLTWIKVTNT